VDESDYTRDGWRHASDEAIPKSTKGARISQSFNIFDFELSSGELAAIDALDTEVRGAPEPDEITLEPPGNSRGMTTSAGAMIAPSQNSILDLRPAVGISELPWAACNKPKDLRRGP